MSSNDYENDIVNNFITEAKENLDIAEKLLLSLEQNNNPEIMNALFRSLHSVKGSAGFLQYKNIEKLSHCAETLLGLIREGKKSIDSTAINLLLRSTDSLKSMVMSGNLGESTDISALIDDYAKQNGVHTESSCANEIDTDQIKFSQELKNSILQKHDKTKLLFSIKINPQDVTNGYGKIRKEIMDAIDGVGCILYQTDNFTSENINEPVCIIFETVLEHQLLQDILPLPEKNITLFTLKNSQIVENHPAQPPADTQKPNIKPAQHQEKSAITKNDATNSLTIRIGVRVLDELLELIGEVVLGRNQIITHLPNDKTFRSLSQSITKLHQYVIHTRMQPIGSLFERYIRTVRDLSLKLGKKIELHIDGSEIELDRTIIEALADPLIHLVRNAVDHGIESIEERSSAGKSVVGNIYIRALHESGQILIEVEDDGKGIDVDRIRTKAVEKGILSEAEAAAASDKELTNIVFHPGFSTKDEVSEISGRGVGMDVVKSNLEKIGCIVEISSRKGRGTIVSARIPLTMAIVNSSVISALIISIGKYALAIPQLAVNEIIRLSPQEQAERIDKINGQEVFILRDKIIPLVHLEDLLGIPRSFYNNYTKQSGVDKRQTLKISEPDILERRKQSVIFIVLQFKQNYFGVLVDHIQGTEEIVVKRLPYLIKNRKVFAGSTILGNGTVALILDINGMVEIADLNFFKKQDTPNTFFIKKSAKEDTQKMVIFNNAIDEYFAIPVNLLSEVDRFKIDEVHRSGQKEYIQRHGESIPLLRLENQLSVNPISKGNDTYTVLIPSRIKYPTGIIGNKIIATTQLTDTINTKESNQKGVMGSLFFDNKLIFLIDIYSLLQHSDPDRFKDILEENLESLRLLVVDDQLFFRQLVSQYFKNYGIKNITVASNGEEALDFLYKNQSSIDIVVSDIEMPVMDGYQLVANIKSSPVLSHLPVMALTTLGSHENIQKGMDAGFDAYEIKIDKDKVVKSLSQLYKKSRNGSIK